MSPNPQFPAHLVTFTEEIINRKLHFLSSDHKPKQFATYGKQIDSYIENRLRGK